MSVRSRCTIHGEIADSPRKESFQYRTVELVYVDGIERPVPVTPVRRSSRCRSVPRASVSNPNSSPTVWMAAPNRNDERDDSPDELFRTAVWLTAVTGRYAGRRSGPVPTLQRVRNVAVFKSITVGLQIGVLIVIATCRSSVQWVATKGPSSGYFEYWMSRFKMDGTARGGVR